jgi:hypothetical protein
MRYANIKAKATNIAHRRTAESDETRQYARWGTFRTTSARVEGGTGVRCRDFLETLAARTKLAIPLLANWGKSREACIVTMRMAESRVLT